MSLRLRVPVVAIIAVGLAVTIVASQMATAAGVSAARAHASRVVHRCGYARSPLGRLGVYITKGDVSCARGAFLLHRPFFIAGTPTGTGNTVRYSDGWLCGGGMGHFACARPSLKRPSQYVQGLLCDFRFGNHGCPFVFPYKVNTGLHRASVTGAMLGGHALNAVAAIAPRFCGTFVRPGQPPNSFRITAVRVEHISCANSGGTLMVFNGRYPPPGWRLRRAVQVAWSRVRQNELLEGKKRIWYERYIRGGVVSRRGRECGYVGFPPIPGDNVASDIRTVNVSCVIARRVAAASRPDRLRLPGHTYRALSFRCNGTNTPGLGKASVHYDCTRQDASITFERT